MRSPLLATSLVTTLAIGAAACDDRASGPASRTDTVAAPGLTQGASSAGSSAAPARSAEKQPPIADAGVAAAPADAGPYTGPLLGSMVFEASIMSDMEWPSSKEHAGQDKVVRIGYLRHGGMAPVIPEPHKKSNCSEGWYELVAGGFVCGRQATVDVSHPRVRLAPHPPNMDGPLPYQYGYNVANGTPLYRAVPSREERLKLEPWLRPKAKPVRRNDDDDDDPEPRDAGGQQPASGPGDEAPWYLREYDGGKPSVTLDDLRGEGGPIARRMVRGFFVALDKSFGSGGSMWWRTTGGLVAPADRIGVQKLLTEFHGVWLNTEQSLANGDAGTSAPDSGERGDGGASVTSAKTPGLPMAFFVAKGAKFSMTADKKRAAPSEPAARFSYVGLTGEEATIGSNVYLATVDGKWVRARDVALTKPGPAPAELSRGEKWVDVNLSTQTLVLFEGEKPVYATLVSTGRKTHETPTGSYRVREKHVAATMDGDVAQDGPYSIEDVPWIMYFNGSYALHGAFWHANFGHVQSHGCVNLSPIDARAIFGWTEPSLPQGWHGVWATHEHPGTRVVVHH